ncbi:MAG: hypothetical protein M5U28_06205 [Sandaracinaceae bacterium]|nr:hypothetical protein [Sandaracinaceae bacterium]
MSIAGLSVRRLAYVPASGGDWARYLEVLENTGSSAVSTTVSITGNLGSDSLTVLHASSSGDAFASTADLWFASDDSSDGSGDPSLAHVFSGSSSSITPSAVSLVTDNLTYTWNVTVPAGGRVVLMHFAVQTSNRAASVAEAMRLVEAPDDAVLGIDDYLDDIANFGVATPGAPRVRFTGPFSADEGSEVVLEVAVEDLEGDSYSFSWDLDDDGTFGEAPDATSYTIAAGTTDGPGAVRVGVRAVDAGGNASERYRTIQIVNVAPAVTSDPPLSTSVGVDFRYPLVVDDPAGELDALTFAIVRGPSRMTVSPEGSCSGR